MVQRRMPLSSPRPSRTKGSAEAAVKVIDLATIPEVVGMLRR
jgi:hypothetical protein